MTGSPEAVLAKLKEAGRRDLRDFMTFEVMPDAGHPQPAQPNQVLVAGSTKDRVGDAFVLAGWAHGG